MTVLPLTTRPRDTYYVLFLLSYVPAILLFDSIPLYPQHLVPAPLKATQEWYISFFGDPLISYQPAWFRFFALGELCYQLPAAFYLISLFRRGSPKAPAHAMLWATICAYTTWTCVFEFYHSPQMLVWQKQALGALYSSYGVIFTLMAADMFCRIQKTLSATALLGNERKAR